MTLLKSNFTADERQIVTGAVIGTTASVFPAFLTGAVGVQLRDSIGLTEAALGLAIGAFFLSAAVGSALLGRVAQRLGGPNAMRLGLTMTILTGLAIAAFARSPASLAALMLVAGTSNALTQPAANLMLADGLADERLGMALALKQSGMPAATMLGGLAVPALALTLGWQSGFVAGAAVAALALAALPKTSRFGAWPRETPQASDRPTATPPPKGVPDLPLSLLLTYAAVGGLGAAAAGSLVGFLVSGAEAAGTSPGLAGLLLTGGSVVGISSRILQGRLVDRGSVLPIKRTALLFALGSVGMLMLSRHTAAWYVVGVIPAFGFGWAWPGLFNLSVIRNNPSAPGAATGVSQTGVYIGAGAGPAAGGWIIATGGYSALWVTGAVALGCASLLALALRVFIRRERSGRVPLLR